MPVTSQQCFQCTTGQHLHGDSCGLFKLSLFSNGLWFCWPWVLVLCLTYWVAGWPINHTWSQQGQGPSFILCMYTVPYIVELWLLNRSHRCYHQTTSNSTRIFRYSDCQKNQAEWINSPLFLQLSLKGGTPEKMVLSKMKKPLASCPKHPASHGALSASEAF